MDTITLRHIQPSEALIQDAVLRFLKIDRRIAWAHRFNTGAHVIEGKDARGRPKRRFIRYAFPGCSDILGQFRDGRLLAVEVKASSGRLTAEQREFLRTVAAANGVAIVARSIEGVRDALDAEADQKAPTTGGSNAWAI